MNDNVFESIDVVEKYFNDIFSEFRRFKSRGRCIFCNKHIDVVYFYVESNTVHINNKLLTLFEIENKNGFFRRMIKSHTRLKKVDIIFDDECNFNYELLKNN